MVAAAVPAGGAGAVTVGGGAVVDGAGAAAVAARATDAEGAHPDGAGQSRIGRLGRARRECGWRGPSVVDTAAGTGALLGGWRWSRGNVCLRRAAAASREEVESWRRSRRGSGACIGGDRRAVWHSARDREIHKERT